MVKIQRLSFPISEKLCLTKYRPPQYFFLGSQDRKKILILQESTALNSGLSGHDLLTAVQTCKKLPNLPYGSMAWERIGLGG